jgi:integrase
MQEQRRQGAVSEQPLKQHRCATEGLPGKIFQKASNFEQPGTLTVGRLGMRGRAIVRGGAGTAARAVGLLGGILTYAIEHAIIERNPVHGVRKPADRVKTRRLSEHEYRVLGRILDRTAEDDRFGSAVSIVRLLALTGCRRGEIVYLKRAEVDRENSCLRLSDSKEGTSIRPIGLPALDLLDPGDSDEDDVFVFPDTQDDKPLVGFPTYWQKLVEGGSGTR